MPIIVLDYLAYTLGRNDEEPNIALAEMIVTSSDKLAVKELIYLLHHKTSAVRSDVIKVIYEIAEKKVELILPYTGEILALLNHKDNRMKWGAMSALSAMSKVDPDLIAGHLPSILDAMDKGSVITRDHGIIILCEAAFLKAHHDNCMELLLEQIEKAPVNQVPMYAEKMAEVISPPYVKRLDKILRSRKDVLEIPSKKKRIEKLLKSIALK